MGKKHESASCRITIRLTPSEYAHVESEAANLPISVYIREKLLSDSPFIRKTRNRTPIKDHEILAQIIGLLGSGRIANNLNQLAKAANSGKAFSEDEKALLFQSCAEIRAIRDMNMQGLGLKED